MPTRAFEHCVPLWSPTFTEEVAHGCSVLCLAGAWMIMWLREKHQDRVVPRHRSGAWISRISRPLDCASEDDVYPENVCWPCSALGDALCFVSFPPASSRGRRWARRTPSRGGAVQTPSLTPLNTSTTAGVSTPDPRAFTPQSSRYLVTKSQNLIWLHWCCWLSSLISNWCSYLTSPSSAVQVHFDLKSQLHRGIWGKKVQLLRLAFDSTYLLITQ